MSVVAARLLDLIADADYWRCASAAASAPGRASSYKEWQHFVLFGADYTLVFNLNIDAAQVGGDTDARVITILSAAQWQGQVERCPRPRLRLGSLDAQFGQAGMRWRDGHYEIWQHHSGIRLEISLRPSAAPSLTHNIRLGNGTQLSWCLVPRLVATGWVESDGRRIAIDAVPAYHDHNWGHFAWGGDFSWDWGCALPADPALPWTLIFTRMNSRDHHRTTATSAFLLENGQHLRYFRNAEVRFTSTEGVATRPAARVPAAAALLLPDLDNDVPPEMRIEAARGPDWLHAVVQAGKRGQILVPSDTDLRRVLRVNEADARIEVKGECAGKAVRFEGPALLEVVRG